MKIINFRQEDTCYMHKDGQLRIERSDIWGKPEENSDSLLRDCEKFLACEDDTVHVVYLYGQGGEGKSYVFRKITDRLLGGDYQKRLYVAAIDLQMQKNFEDNLKCLADEIAGQAGKDLFPRFHMAYYNYKLKAGEEFEEEERTTKWDDIQNSTPLSLVTGAAGFLDSIGVVGDVIDLANEGYKWFLKMRSSMQYKAVAAQIEAMDARELKEQLTRYFAADFCAFMEEKNKKKKKIAFLLDTVESMRYQVLRSGGEEDYLEWLTGINGLLRLLPGCFWLLFGREEIPWENYDSEWEVSFHDRKIGRPDEAAVRKYLIQQLGRKMPEDRCGAEEVLEELVDRILEQTERYPLAVENCIDAYFRIWNGNLRKNRVTDQKLADRYRPCLEEMPGMILDARGERIISERFLMYYTKQEREVLYTLVCLGTWTDEILETVIFKGAVSKLLIYQELCVTSFIRSDGTGQKSIQGLMQDTIIKDCPEILKKHLFHSILGQIKNRQMDAVYIMLYRSAVRIAQFCKCEATEWTLLGTEFVRVVEYFGKHAWYHEVSAVCGDLFRAVSGRDADGDLCNAARIGRYFAQIYMREDVTEGTDLLEDEGNFSIRSWRIWEIMVKAAFDARAYWQAYKVTALLEEKLPKAGEGTELIFYRRMIPETQVRLMMQLTDQFTHEEIEEKIEHFCASTRETMWDDPAGAERIAATLWSKYYFGCRKDLTSEFVSKKIEACIRRYRDSCTDREVEEDATIYVLETMQKFDDRREEASAAALKGMRILEETYGDAAAERADMEFLFGAVLPVYFMPEEDRELFCRIFEIYYQRFCRGGDWELYNLLEGRCFAVGFMQPKSDGADGEERIELSDVIQKGIVYLSNLAKNDAQVRLILQMCYYLLDLSVGGISVTLDDDVWLTIDGRQLLERKLLNNQILLYFLQKSLEAVSQKKGDSEIEQLSTLLKAIFREKCFYSAAEEEKRSLFGLLKLSGMEMDGALWKIEYIDSTEKADDPLEKMLHPRVKEYRLLQAFYGWQWGIDWQADIRMVNVVLRVVNILDEYAVSMEKQILADFKELLSGGERAEFWLALLEEASSDGEEWEKHVRQLFQEELRSLNIWNVSEKTRQRLAMYDTRFEKQESAGSSSFEADIRAKLAEGEYEAVRDMLREVKEGYQEYQKDQNRADYALEGKLRIAIFYVPMAKEAGPDEVIEHIQEKKQIPMMGGEYAVLRAYAYLGDKDSVAAHYREKRQEILDGLRDSIWFEVDGEICHMAECISDAGDSELVVDFCRQAADLCAERGKLWYTGGILYYLERFMELVPFEVIWRREACIKAIEPSNYDKIYGIVRDYLSREELLDVFAADVFDFRGAGMRCPKKTDLSFLESEYVQWLSEALGEAAWDRLRKKFPELFEIRVVYENGQKNSYHFQIENLCRCLARGTLVNVADCYWLKEKP